MGTEGWARARLAQRVCLALCTPHMLRSPTHDTHCRRRKAQVRPLPQYQKAAARQGMETDERAESPSSPAPGAAEPGSVARLAAADADAVAGALTRLSVAAEHSRVPNVVSFGRGRGMGLPAVARGRGGQRLHAGAAE